MIFVVKRKESKSVGANVTFPCIFFAFAFCFFVIEGVGTTFGSPQIYIIVGQKSVVMMIS